MLKTIDIDTYNKLLLSAEKLKLVWQLQKVANSKQFKKIVEDRLDKHKREFEYERFEMGCN